MLIKWFGHACFMIRASDTGLLILTDPFDESVGYPLPDVSPNLVTESHQHFDHNAHAILKGSFNVLKNSGMFEYDEVKIKAIESFHDKSMGKERGMNLIFKFEFLNGTNIAHLGDLGHVVDDNILKELLPVDVLLIPVGGKFTIGPEEAVEVCDLVKPKVIIPMHYKTRYLNFPIKSVDEFIKVISKKSSVDIVQNENNIFEFEMKELRRPKPLVLVMNI